MGIEFSTFNILGSCLNDEVVTETGSGDNKKVVTKRKNPWVTGVVIGSATLLCMTYLDGGKGMVSKTFGKSCLSCSAKLVTKSA